MEPIDRGQSSADLRKFPGKRQSFSQTKQSTSFPPESTDRCRERLEQCNADDIRAAVKNVPRQLKSFGNSCALSAGPFLSLSLDRFFLLVLCTTRRREREKALFFFRQSFIHLFDLSRNNMRRGRGRERKRRTRPHTVRFGAEQSRIQVRESLCFISSRFFSTCKLIV